ncbi:MAG: hypothetical protein ABL994_19850, partial [Verrucomicrobiales bacterium]
MSLSRFAHDAIEGLTGAESALKNALSGAASDQLSKGVNALNRVMNDQPNALFEAALRNGLNTPLESLYGDIKTAYVSFSTRPVDFASAVRTSVKARLSAAQIQTVLLGQGGPNEALSVVRQIQNSLSETIQGVKVVEDLLSPAGREQRLRSLIQSLVGADAPALIGQLGAGLAKQAFADLLAELQPSMDTLLADVTETRTRLESLRDKLGSAGFPELNSILGVELQKAVNSLADDVAGAIPAAQLADGRYFNEHSQTIIMENLRRRLIDAVLGSGVAKAYQTALKERLYDLQARMRSGMDGVFQTANQLATEALSSALSEIDKEFSDFLGSNLSDVMASAKLDGHAHIVGDSIKELTLDADLRLKIPDDFGFHGFLRIRELSSDNTPVGCLAGYDKATEVVMGAKDVSLSWLSPKLKAGLQGKFIFKAQNGNFEVVGMGGGVSVNGAIKFEV